MLKEFRALPNWKLTARMPQMMFESLILRWDNREGRVYLFTELDLIFEGSWWRRPEFSTDNQGRDLLRVSKEEDWEGRGHMRWDSQKGDLDKSYRPKTSQSQSSRRGSQKEACLTGQEAHQPQG